jgi:hypothetical protein
MAGKLKGYFGASLATLESIKKKDRSSVMGSTSLKTEISNKIDNATGQESIQVKITPEQARQPIHIKHVERIQAAIKIGMRALKTPRIGGFQVSDQNFYAPDDSGDSLSERLDKTIAASRAIEDRGVGYAVAKSIADEFAKRDKVLNEMPMQSLGRARDAHEEGRVSRAIVEWADGDSVAAHIGYGIDVFCTEDEGKSAGTASVLDSTSRTWLEAIYGVKFVTLSELAKMI